MPVQSTEPQVKNQNEATYSRHNIEVVNSRVHNLKNLSVSIPRNQLVVFTGVSGSGKYSLVYDTIYAESRRQLLETFSSYARNRMSKTSRPDADGIFNISTPIVINQRPMGTNPRSTVGTATDIYSYIRLLYSRFDDNKNYYPASSFSFNDVEGMCTTCRGLGLESVPDVSRLVDFNLSVRDGAIKHSMFAVGKWFWKALTMCGFFDPDKPIKDFTDEELHMLLYSQETKFKSDRMGEEYESKYTGVITKIRERHERGTANPAGFEDYISQQTCSDCKGSRLNKRAQDVSVYGITLNELVHMEMPELYNFISSIKFPEAQPITSRIAGATRNLIEIGAGYLHLNRSVGTLSGGESQRVKMARQLDCDLINMIYILDEPTSGLHPKDVDAVIAMLKRLRDRENSVLVVEHDPEVILSADSIVEIGPGAGSKGGELIFAGSRENFLKQKSTTATELEKQITIGKKRVSNSEAFIIRNASKNNLKNISVSIPSCVLVAVTGPAGSGKSTLIHNHFMSNYPDAICVDQGSPFRSSRSTAMSYTKIFDAIRSEFASATSSAPGLFSFNSKGGCPECNGQGQIKIDMSFLEEMTTTCKACNGKRYIDSVLQLEYKGKNIYDILCMTALDARDYFEDPVIKHGLDMLIRVGLDYIQLGQSMSTLSGGELQRLKLAKEFKNRGHIYVLDEPTSGLHLKDINRLLGILQSLVDNGNSVIVIEHNLQIVANADWIIDLGPEGGKNGGELVAQGTPEAICKNENSVTGQYLKRFMEGN
ncbi:MAG: excinuclease ABC subunit UvrA [Spirochaetes bacterium]|jgi:excinuclease UvrABC ATPase subunit|nr:excinuclease ABC subunit UvrA [Spirochaetota bacterium]